LAEAGHMLTDVGGLAAALVAIRIAERRATPEHTFGFYRAEILAALLNALVALRGGAAESLNLKSAYYEVFSDALTALGVIVASIVVWTTGWYYADPLASAAIGLFILPRTWRLLREAVRILLEGTPADVNLAVLRDALEAVPGVSAVHDLHVWALTSGMNAMSLHAVIEV